LPNESFAMSKVESAKWTAIDSIETFECASKAAVDASRQCRQSTTLSRLLRYFSVDFFQKTNRRKSAVSEHDYFAFARLESIN